MWCNSSGEAGLDGNSTENKVSIYAENPGSTVSSIKHEIYRQYKKISGHIQQNGGKIQENGGTVQQDVGKIRKNGGTVQQYVGKIRQNGESLPQISGLTV